MHDGYTSGAASGGEAPLEQVKLFTREAPDPSHFPIGWGPGLPSLGVPLLHRGMPCNSAPNTARLKPPNHTHA